MPTEAARHAGTTLHRRRRARQSVLAFSQFVRPWYKADPMHRVMADYVDRAMSGEIQRLMIFAPPQHGKSSLACEAAAALWAARHPDEPVGIASYEQTIVRERSRAIKDMVDSYEFLRLFRDRVVSRESRSVDRWTFDGHGRGGLWAAGAGSAITGRGAALALIDDPLRNLEDAMSQAMRDRAWRTWDSTLRPRLREGASVILTQTRWHEDDLAGRLLAEQGDIWTVLRIPALAESQKERDAHNGYLGLPVGEPDPLGREEGEPCAPSLYSREAEERTRAEIFPATWQSLYQGVPMPLGGIMFDIDKIDRIEKPPARLHAVCSAWDLAGSAGRGDWSVRVKMGSDGRRYIILNVARERAALAERDIMMKQLAKVDGPTVTIGIPKEPSHTGKREIETLERLLVGYRVVVNSVSKSKELRAEPFATDVAHGRVAVIDDGTWNVAAYLEELRRFPRGQHDDQVDASGDAHAMVAQRMRMDDGVTIVEDGWDGWR